MRTMKLRTYLDQHRISASEFARLINVRRMTVHRYLGDRVPRPEILKRITEATNGAVTANDFIEPPDQGEAA